jgi:hypothetical protein
MVTHVAYEDVIEVGTTERAPLDSRQMYTRKTIFKLRITLNARCVTFYMMQQLFCGGNCAFQGEFVYTSPEIEQGKSETERFG